MSCWHYKSSERDGGDCFSLLVLLSHVRSLYLCWLNPLPLLPKAASVEWAWPVTSRPCVSWPGGGAAQREGGGGGGGLEAGQQGRFPTHDRPRPLSVTPGFVIVPMALCPHWSAGKSCLPRQKLRVAHTDTLGHTSFMRDREEESWQFEEK